MKNLLEAWDELQVLLRGVDSGELVALFGKCELGVGTLR